MTHIKWALPVAAILAFAIYAFATVDRSSDQTKIIGIIEKGAEAAENRSAGDMMRFVAEDYKDENGLRKDQLRVLMIQALRAEEDFDLDLKIEDIKIDGDKATAIIGAKVVGGEADVTLYDRKVTLELEKRSSMHMLIIPDSRWSVVSSYNLGLSPQSLI